MAAFNIFDLDGNGVIEYDEIKKVLLKLRREEQNSTKVNESVSRL